MCSWGWQFFSNISCGFLAQSLRRTSSAVTTVKKTKTGKKHEQESSGKKQHPAACKRNNSHAAASLLLSRIIYCSSLFILCFSSLTIITGLKAKSIYRAYKYYILQSETIMEASRHVSIEVANGYRRHAVMLSSNMPSCSFKPSETALSTPVVTTIILLLFTVARWKETDSKRKVLL